VPICDIYNGLKIREYPKYKIERKAKGDIIFDGTFNMTETCDKHWHHWKFENGVTYCVTKCPVWIKELKGEYIEATFPVEKEIKDQTFDNMPTEMFENCVENRILADELLWTKEEFERKKTEREVKNRKCTMVVFGKKGSGKTWFGLGLANVAREGYEMSTKYYLLSEIIDLLYEQFNHETQVSARNSLNKIRSINLLVIDNITDNFKREQDIRDILSIRELHRRRTVLIFNVEKKKISFTKVFGLKNFYDITMM
jgi:DNA replication protein DnaC